MPRKKSGSADSSNSKPAMSHLWTRAVLLAPTPFYNTFLAAPNSLNSGPLELSAQGLLTTSQRKQLERHYEQLASQLHQRKVHQARRRCWPACGRGTDLIAGLGFALADQVLLLPPRRGPRSASLTRPSSPSASARRKRWQRVWGAGQRPTRLRRAPHRLKGAWRNAPSRGPR